MRVQSVIEVQKETWLGLRDDRYICFRVYSWKQYPSPLKPISYPDEEKQKRNAILRVPMYIDEKHSTRLADES